MGTRVRNNNSHLGWPGEGWRPSPTRPWRGAPTAAWETRGEREATQTGAKQRRRVRQEWDRAERIRAVTLGSGMGKWGFFRWLGEARQTHHAAWTSLAPWKRVHPAFLASQACRTKRASASQDSRPYRHPNKPRLHCGNLARGLARKPNTPLLLPVAAVC